MKNPVNIYEYFLVIEKNQTDEDFIFFLLELKRFYHQ
jgi:hypothetical protein